MVVLHPGQVPDEPADRVGAGLRWPGELVGGGAVGGGPHEGGQGAEQLEQHLVRAHLGAVPGIGRLHAYGRGSGPWGGPAPWATARVVRGGGGGTAEGRRKGQ